MPIDPRYEFSRTQINILYTYVVVKYLMKENIAGNLQHTRIYERFLETLRKEFNYLEGQMRAKYSQRTNKPIIRTKKCIRSLEDNNIISFYTQIKKVYAQTRDERLELALDFLRERYFSKIVVRGEGEIQSMLLNSYNK